jgi:DNA polymerase-1
MGYYIPVGHLTGEPQLDLEKVRQSLNPLFLREDIVKVGHNIKYDLIVLRNHGFEVKGKLFDTMVAGWVIDPESKNLGLKAMAFDLLGINMQSIDTLIGKGSNQLTMANVSIKDAAPYAAADADMTLRLVPILKETLKKRETEKIFDELEMPLIPVLTDMEMAGIRVDRDFLKEMSKSLEIRLSEIEKDIYAGVGYEFNINSTQQLSRAIFETLKLEPPGRKKKTTSGLYSTSADVLEEMRGSHPIIDLILEHRELSKLKNTYVDALPLTINRRTGRVHTSFNQTGAVTGRLASSSPNLQNIPTRTELGRKVRTAFIADPDHVLLSVDYSQIELRIVAHMAQDEGMLAAFRAGQDIHATTAAAIYGCDISQVTKEMRRHAKAINFGLIYGMSPYGLSQSANLSRKEAEEFVDAYFKKFPRIKEYLDSIKIQAAEKGYVETMMGRKRYFPNLGQQKNYSLRTREEREAINAPIQGTAADIMKLAMIQVHDKLKKSVLQAQILLQVHDELLLECSQKDLDETRELVQDTMENVVTLSIPLLTEARSGLNWGDLTPMP